MGVKAILVGQTNAIPSLYKITLPATGWVQEGDGYKVTINSLASYVSPNSKIDMQLTGEQMTMLKENGVELIYIANENGAAMVYRYGACGAALSMDIDNVQVVIGEVKQL